MLIWQFMEISKDDLEEQTDLPEEDPDAEEEWIRIQTTGGGAET